VNPIHLGTRERRLFGVFTPSTAAEARGRAAVLCYPWGQEYIRAHRSMHRLAMRLNAAGIDVLRFDYYGSGDSAGEATDVDLEGCRRDIETAIDEIKDTTAATRVSLVGLRLGATLASQVAAQRRSDVDRLALWDPVVSGQAYLRELEDASPLGDADDSGCDLLGFTMTRSMARELNSLELAASVLAWPVRTLYVISDDSPHPSGLTSALAQRTADALTVERIACEPAWLEHRDSGAGAIPVQVLQRLVDWFAS
jgi:pimeloyl-ACP methyl ester carboxylesterase